MRLRPPTSISPLVTLPGLILGILLSSTAVWAQANQIEGKALPLEAPLVTARYTLGFHVGPFAYWTEHRSVWDSRAADGSLAASGVYFARLEASNKVASIRMLLLK